MFQIVLVKLFDDSLTPNTKILGISKDKDKLIEKFVPKDFVLDITEEDDILYISKEVLKKFQDNQYCVIDDSFDLRGFRLEPTDIVYLD